MTYIGRAAVAQVVAELVEVDWFQCPSRRSAPRPTPRRAVVSQQFYPLEGCAKSAAERRTAYAGGSLRLFQSSFTPTPSSVAADYAAAIADYDGYANQTIAAWNVPILAPGTGYMIGSPIMQFLCTGSGTPNTIGGCYYLDAAGVVRATVIFTAPVPMQMAGQGIPINLIDLFPTGA